MKAFIAMPFDPAYDGVWRAIQRVCGRMKVDCIRADEIPDPGPIMGQILSAIEECDCLVAEIGNTNTNVYYELGIAHGKDKPTILLVEEQALPQVPFDLRPSRQILYSGGNLRLLDGPLSEALLVVKAQTLTGVGASASADTLPQDAVDRVLQHLTEAFGLVAPDMLSQKRLPDGSIVLGLRDAFGDTVTALTDPRGNIVKVQRQ